MSRRRKLAPVQPNEATREVYNERKFRSISSLNDGQRQYIRAIHNNDIVIALGKSGTGKSYCAAGLAAEYLNRGLVDKIIICRSSAQADKIGFVPGTAEDKTIPYITQVLIDMADFLSVKKELSEERIEILSMAFARGRSFRNSFIILEESQNCTFAQLKMFITRIGDCSKMVISGDVTQTDLEEKHAGDFSLFINKLSKIATPENKIAIIELRDSVRHPMIETLLNALEN